MDVPDAVTIGVVLYGPGALDADALERESRYAAELAAKHGVPAKSAFGQAIARRVPTEQWVKLIRLQHMDASVDLLASVHFFAGRPAPLLVAGALAVFSHAWLFRREHGGVEPPGSLPLADMPPGPLATARDLRDAAAVVNPVMLDDPRYTAWMRAYESAWGADDRAN